MDGVFILMKNITHSVKNAGTLSCEVLEYYLE